MGDQQATFRQVQCDSPTAQRCKGTHPGRLENKIEFDPLCRDGKLDCGGQFIGQPKCGIQMMRYFPHLDVVDLGLANDEIKVQLTGAPCNAAAAFPIITASSFSAENAETIFPSTEAV